MIVGNGLLAKAFNQYATDQSVIIFASGVSNSGEVDEQAFMRERSLLNSFKDTRAKFIYFSTTSVLDPSLTQSLYVQHKLQMESYIQSCIQNYVIFRLPNVVGRTSNSNTFFNSIRDRLVSGQDVYIKKHATRRLLDVDDIATTLPSIISCKTQTTMNVCYNNRTSVRELVRLMGTILHKEYSEILVDGGGDYDVDNSAFLSYIPIESVALSQDYDYIVLNKYLNNDNILSTK